jgi:putative peptidoglycan lipid II flippase
MNLVFITQLKHAGLALAIGLASCLNAGLLYRGLRKRATYCPQPGWMKFALKIAIALGVLALVLWFGMGREADWLAATSTTRILHLSGLVGGGILAYFATLWMLGFRLRDFRRQGSV